MAKQTLPKLTEEQVTDYVAKLDLVRRNKLHLMIYEHLSKNGYRVQDVNEGGRTWDRAQLECVRWLDETGTDLRSLEFEAEEKIKSLNTSAGAEESAAEELEPSPAN